MNTTTPTTTTNDPNGPEAVLKRACRFKSRELAFSFAYRAAKPMRVMLGDDERYWVVTPADASRLERWGYEYAN